MLGVTTTRARENMEDESMYDTDKMVNPTYRRYLAEKLSAGGRFKVLFGHYPDAPEVLEYIGPSDARGVRLRYVNLDAAPNAKVSKLILR